MKNISVFKIGCNAKSDLKIVNQSAIDFELMVGQLRNDSCLLEVKFQGRHSLIAAFFGMQLGWRRRCVYLAVFKFLDS